MADILPQIEFYHGPDGRRLAVRVWRPNVATRGRVVFLHGITSHGGWYTRSCQHLAAVGLEVHFLDRRGSGLNVEAKGDIDRWQTWVSDVAEYLKHCQVSGVRCQGEQDYSATEIRRTPVLCGISWGGKLAVAVARQHPESIGGLGLICPGLFSHQEAGFLKGVFLALPLPDRVLNRHVQIPLSDPALFIEDRRGQSFVATDPLSLREITVRFAQQDRQLTKFARSAASYLHTPLLLMLAGRDRIVDRRRTLAFFRRVSAHKTLIEYPNATHTIEFEADPTRYFRDLTDWIGAVHDPIGQECCL